MLEAKVRQAKRLLTMLPLVLLLTPPPPRPTQDFHGLDKGVILEALRTLQEQGRADLYEGSSLDEMGVKFLE